jgi:3-methyladenine DNA glycosylase/8-oxoguanine DNA glycosylase
VTEVRVEVRPPWPYRLPAMVGKDGLTRRRCGVLHRLLHQGEHRVLLRVAQLTSGNVLIGAAADDRRAAAEAIERMRRALGVDLDLKPFHDRFRDDPLIGPSVRRNPHKRPFGRPDPFEALTWAICEQLIEYERAAAIQRRLIARFGRRCHATGMRDAPTAQALAGQAPALFESFDLSAGRSLALHRAAREVSRGRVDLSDPDHERGWARLRAIPGIGSWTVQVLALTGQGRLDQLPAGDLKFLKFLGRLQSGGDPRARATEQEVADFFAPYAPYSGLAGLHALAAGGVKAPAIIHA